MKCEQAFVAQQCRAGEGLQQGGSDVRDALRVVCRCWTSVTSTRYSDPNFCLRCCGVPSACSCPLTMIPMRVQSASASSIECVVSTTEREAMVLMSVFQRFLLDT